MMIKGTLVGVLFAAGAPCAVAAGWDFSAAQLSCANDQKIDLTQAPSPDEALYLTHLTWLADHVVIGTVSEIKHDIRGPYPTLVHLDVAEALKGSLTGEIVVALESDGPRYDATIGKFAQLFASGEPVFEKGEEVLVFLTKKYTVIPEMPEKFALPPGTYRPFVETKLRLDSEKATLVGGDRAYGRKEARGEVLAAVAYAVSCRGH
jgi:hypothetical protein